MSQRSQMSTGDLNIRKIDRKILRDVKSVAAAEGLTIREWIVRAIKLAVERHGKASRV